mmetsp:Transcript_33378/g.84585  ORF Transcript_33378/g.84585 Transcript_33378/m.84585 type:complete len:305 (+) Transcript_33378:706-1620(+)
MAVTSSVALLAPAILAQLAVVALLLLQRVLPLLALRLVALLEVHHVLAVARVTLQRVVHRLAGVQHAVLDVPHALGLALVHPLLPLQVVQPVARARVHHLGLLAQRAPDQVWLVAQRLLAAEPGGDVGLVRLRVHLHVARDAVLVVHKLHLPAVPDGPLPPQHARDDDAWQLVVDGGPICKLHAVDARLPPLDVVTLDPCRPVAVAEEHELARGVHHLPAADGWVVADLLAVHLHAVAELRLVCLTQDRVEGFVKADLPAQPAACECHHILHALHRVCAVGCVDQKVQVLKVLCEPLQEGTRLE